MHTAIVDLVEARNECRESLRTPGFSTEYTQGEWFETINKPDSKMWYWEFIGLVNEDIHGGPGYGGKMGVGGLTFDRFNRSAEISVLTFVRRKGYGQKIVDWLIREAFNAQNMHKVWAEVYACNPNSDAWPRLLEKWNPVGHKRTDSKYWDGVYWDSTVYECIRAYELTGTGDAAS
jgi:RimJ/RimL family protein N-acetyltransferase